MKTTEPKIVEIDHKLIEMTIKERGSKLCTLYCSISDWDRASLTISSMIKFVNHRLNKSYSIEGDRRMIKEE